MRFAQYLQRFRQYGSSAARTQRPKKYSQRPGLERLEDRALPSTIVWTNQFSDTTFAATYGANAARARAIVNVALRTWEGIIQNFNYRNVGQSGWAPVANRYEFSITAGDQGGCAAGVAAPSRIDPDGKPFQGWVAMDNAGGCTGSCFLDPTPNDNAEFSNLLNRFTAGNGPGGSDFYSVALHEIGHALGIALGFNMTLDRRVFNPGLPPPHHTLRALNFTDGGRATLQNDGHTFDGPPMGGFPSHPYDLMNSSIDGSMRRLISDLDARIMRDGYDYTISLPSTRQTFLANFNSTTGLLTVNGDPLVVHDTITFDCPSESNIRVNVNGIVANFPMTSVTAITVNAAAGDDTVNIVCAPAGKITTVNAGAGNDVIHVGNGGVDGINGSLVINGSAGSDRLQINDQAYVGPEAYTITANTARVGGLGVITYVAVEQLTVQTSRGNDGVVVLGTALGTTVQIHSGLGDDVIVLGSASNSLDSIRGRVDVNSGTGVDTLTLNDHGDGDASTFTLSSTTIQRSGMALVSYGPLWTLHVNAGTSDDTINVLRPNAFTTTINSGNGSDVINVRQTSAGGYTRVNAGAGADTINVGDLTDSLEPIAGFLEIQGDLGSVDTLNLRNQGEVNPSGYILAQTQVQRAGSGVVDYRGIETLNLNAGSNNDTITVWGTASGTTTAINAGAGNDTLAVSPPGNNLNSITGTIVFNGDSGSDTLSLDDRGNTVNSSYSIRPASMSRQGTAALGYNAVESIGIYGGSGSDTVVLEGVAAATVLTFNAGAGNDALSVGTGTISLSAIQGTLVVDGQDGADQVNFTDQAALSPHSYTLTSDTLTRSGAGLMRYFTFENVVLTASNNGNTIAVESTLSSTLTTVNTGPGDDAVEVQNTDGQLVVEGGLGDDVVSLGRALAALPPRLTFRGGAGGDALDYSAHLANVYVNLRAGQATGTNGLSSIEYALGGSGNDILVGFDGNVLAGGPGRDLLIGGAAPSVLFGDFFEDLGEDILIAGTTAYDGNAAALTAIRDFWAGGATYETRVAGLRSGAGVPRLDASTVTSNGGPNLLLGGGGRDFVFIRPAVDIFIDPEEEETVVPI